MKKERVSSTNGEYDLRKLGYYMDEVNIDYLNQDMMAKVLLASLEDEEVLSSSSPGSDRKLIDAFASRLVGMIDGSMTAKQLTEECTGFVRRANLIRAKATRLSENRLVGYCVNHFDSMGDHVMNGKLYSAAMNLRRRLPGIRDSSLKDSAAQMILHALKS
jgi:hypothetical protein